MMISVKELTFLSNAVYDGVDYDGWAKMNLKIILLTFPFAFIYV